MTTVKASREFVAQNTPRSSEGWGYLAQLSFNYFGWLFCWTVAASYMVPNTLLRMVDDAEKNTRFGLMVGVSNVFMLVVIPLAGTLSDRLRWRLGRRRSFYLPSALAVGALIFLVVRCRYYSALFVLMMLMHGTYACWFPNYALLRDVVPLNRRGRISGLANITSTLGIIVGHTISPYFIAKGQMLALALIAGSANLLANLWVALKIREESPVEQVPRKSFSLKEAYVPKLEGASSLGWLAAVNLLTQMGAVAMLCFLLYFVKDQIDKTHFNETYRNANLIGAGAGVCSAIAAGWVADRFGRKRVLLVACILQIACMVIYFFLPWVSTTLYCSAFLFGLGNAAYWSIYWALLSDLVPEGETSKYMALIQYTSILPWAVVPAVLGPVVDGFGAASGQGYKVLFITIIVILTLGLLLIPRIPETLKKGEPKAFSPAVGV
jgi:MFS family permease